MKEEKVFETKVNESAEIIIDIKENYNKDINTMSKLYKLRYGRKPGEFKFFMEVLMNADKLKAYLSKFIVLCKISKKMNLTLVEELLERDGIKLDLENTDLKVADDQQAFIKYWNDVFGGTVDKLTDVEILGRLCSEALDKKKSIQALKEELNTNIIEISTVCDIVKPVVSKSIKLKTKKLEQKDISEEANSIIKNNNELELILEKL